MSPPLTFLLVAAMVANGALAGLFFAFACAVAPGFRHLDDIAYVHGFRAINRAILNGWFLLVFVTAPTSAVACAVFGSRQTGQVQSPWIWAAAGCAVLTFAVTVVGNVPLNTRLDRASATTKAECRAERDRFESRWNTWNLIRTITGFGALACLGIAAVLA